MKYNLIFKEKQKKLFFFINLKYILNLLSFFDFMNFQLIEFFKIIFIFEKFVNYKFLIVIQILLKNFLFKKNNPLKILNFFSISKLYYFYKKNLFFIIKELKTPVITLANFFLIFFFKFEKTLRFKYNNFNKTKYNSLKNNFIKYMLFSKNFLQKFMDINIRMYIYLLIKISKKFKNNFKIKNIYQLRSFFFQMLLHFFFQKNLKQNIILYNLYL